MIPTTYKEYYGDETRWFVGTVVYYTKPDPLLLGRVKVRIYGVHPDDPKDAKPEDLPWAQVVIPGTEPGVSGLGLSVSQLKPTAQVFGLFLDGKNSQIPLVLGSIPKNESEVKQRNRVIVDKNEYYVNDTNVVNVSNQDDSARVVYTSIIKTQTRNKNLVPELFQKIQKAAEAVNVRVMIRSAGQDIEGHGNRRVGTTRHDAGMAADIAVVRMGKDINNSDNWLRTDGSDSLMIKFAEECGAAGIQGFGAHRNYMGGNQVHVDLWGSLKGGETWGTPGKGATPELKTAFRNGKKRSGQNGIVNAQSIKSRVSQKSLAVVEFENKKKDLMDERTTVEASTIANKIGSTAQGFETISAQTGSQSVNDGPVVAKLTDTLSGFILENAVDNSSTLNQMTGLNVSNGMLEETITQASPKGMNEVLKTVVLVPESKIANIVKDTSAIPNAINKAIDDLQIGGIEKVTADIAQSFSKRVSEELGNPFGSANIFGSIGSGVSHILPQILNLTYNQPGIQQLKTDTSFLPDGVTITDKNGNKVQPPSVIVDGGNSNITEIVSEKETNQNTYVIGLFDADWQGANTRGINAGGTYRFATLGTEDHVEAEFRYASNQREITSLIIDWPGPTGLGGGWDDFEVDYLHDTYRRLHNQLYGPKVVNANPTDYGFQTHLYVHQSGKVKRVVPPKNKINALKYPVRQSIYDKCIMVMLNNREGSQVAPFQTIALDAIIKTFMKVFPGAEILGANNLLPNKATAGPGLDVKEYAKVKFGKRSIFSEDLITSIPSASSLADRKAAESIVTAAEHNKTKTIAKQVQESTSAIDYQAAAESYALENQQVMDLIRQKSESATVAIKQNGSGITDDKTKRLDALLDEKLNNNLKNKMEALKNNQIYDDETNSWTGIA